MSNLTSGFIDLATFNNTDLLTYFKQYENENDNKIQLERDIIPKINNSSTTWSTSVTTTLTIKPDTKYKQWNSKFIARISRAADYLNGIHIMFKLPEINLWLNKNTYIKWCDNIEHNIFKSIKLIIETNDTNYELVSYDSVALDQISTYYNITRSNYIHLNFFSSIIPETVIWFTIPFLTNGSSTILPMAILPYTDAYIEFELNDIYQLLLIKNVNEPKYRKLTKYDIIKNSYIPGLNHELAFIIKSYISELIPKEIDIVVHADYLLVSGGERSGLGKIPISLVINSTFTLYQDIQGPDVFINNISPLIGAVKSLYFGIKYKKYPSYYTGKETIKWVKLYYEETMRLNHPGSYFSQIEPKKYGQSILIPGLYMYSYSFIKNRISGSTNYNSLTNCSFVFTVEDFILEEKDSYEVFIVFEYHNPILFKGGTILIPK